MIMGCQALPGGQCPQNTVMILRLRLWRTQSQVRLGKGRAFWAILAAKNGTPRPGLDYFGARYLSSAQGRFTTPDPMTASARASNPQTWNRYSYTLNNPLRFIDPDGLEVPESCAKDPNCTIKIKVNVIYDKGTITGKGLHQSKNGNLKKNSWQRHRRILVPLTFSWT